MVSLFAQNIMLQTLHWLSLYLPSLYAGLTALSVSALMDLRAGEPFRHIITGAGICGIVGVSISSLLQYFGLPPNGGAFAGAIIGLIGASKLADFALGLVLRRTIDKADK